MIPDAGLGGNSAVQSNRDVRMLVSSQLGMLPEVLVQMWSYQSPGFDSPSKLMFALDSFCMAINMNGVKMQAWNNVQG